MVYRVAQEALTNVARHAEATQVDLLLDRSGRDEAVCWWFETTVAAIPPGALPSSRGIRGMRERAMLIGAKLEIDIQTRPRH